jgi:hypothetical protein
MRNNDPAKQLAVVIFANPLGAVMVGLRGRVASACAEAAIS